MAGAKRRRKIKPLTAVYLISLTSEGELFRCEHCVSYKTMGTGRCGGGRYGGGHYGGRRYGGGRYGGAFLKGVDATAEPPDTHFTMDATAEIRRFPCSIAVKA